MKRYYIGTRALGTLQGAKTLQYTTLEEAVRAALAVTTRSGETRYVVEARARVDPPNVARVTMLDEDGD